MITKRIQKILVKYLTNQTNTNDLEALEQWIGNFDDQKEFNEIIKTNYLIDYSLKKFDKTKVKLKLLKLIEKEEKKAFNRRRILKFSRYAAISIGVFFLINFLNNDASGDSFVNPPTVVNNTIEIGKDKAVLTLEDNSVIELSKGSTIQTSNAKSSGGKLVYQSNSRATKIIYNYLTIPRGGQYQITLSDGTEVWLNSESQLKFPIHFIDGMTRQVELVYGEAYFDVSPSTMHQGSKFNVLNQSQEVEVLGTEFNIKAYKDETNIFTTLIEGKVIVDYNGEKLFLEPGKQAMIDIKTQQTNITKVDVNTVVAWKNGVFSFKDKPLKEIMKLISRWYDVDVVFENKDLELIRFRGVLDKNQKIEEILSIMKSTTINNYEIQNKTIFIR